MIQVERVRRVEDIFVHDKASGYKAWFRVTGTELHLERTALVKVVGFGDSTNYGVYIPKAILIELRKTAYAVMRGSRKQYSAPKGQLNLW